MKSIMQKKDGTCYLCRKLYKDYSQKVTHCHHVIFGTANRKLSEKYGLKVYLCPYHHEYGPEAVHLNAAIANELKAEAQETFEKTFPALSWMQIFGKNYIDRPEKPAATPKQPENVEKTSEGRLSGITFLEGNY